MSADEPLSETYRRAREGRRQTAEIKKMPRRKQVLAAQAARPTVHVIHRRKGIRGATARVLRRLADRLDT